MINKKLSIVIPTFNRHEILKNNILLMLKEIKFFSIPIYISDDSTNQHTQKVVTNLKKKYNNIFYSKNKPSLGHDRNILHSLKLPNSKYIWLLGDALSFQKKPIENILKIIDKKKPSIIGINIKYRNLNIKSGYYNNPNRVLEQFGWHLTLTGATIYSRTAIYSIDKIDNEKCKNFPQIALIFSYLSIDNSFYWINKKLLYCSFYPEVKRSFWVNNFFQVFIKDWSLTVNSLPDYYEEICKVRTIIKHSKKVGIFDLKSLLYARSIGLYDLEKFFKYINTLPHHSGIKIPILLIIAILPKSILNTLKLIKGKYNVI